MERILRFAATAAVSAAVAAAGLGLGAGVAQAQQGQTWCPGQALPESMIRWDMTVCHTWYFVGMGTGNVEMVGLQGEHIDSWISADIPPTGVRPSGSASTAAAGYAVLQPARVAVHRPADLRRDRRR